jgi:DNA-binding CsgD family transcriptional regulator
VSTTSRAAPLTLSPLALPDLLSAGIEKMLQPYADRVAFVRDGILSCDVALVDPDLLQDRAVDPVGRPLVAVTRAPEDLPAKVADELGVMAVVSPGATARELLRVVEQVVEQAASGDVDGGAAERRLTAREAAIVTLICQGSSNSQIARALFLSPNSVKSYIRTAYRKMGVTSRSQAVLWGVHRGVG